MSFVQSNYSSQTIQGHLEGNELVGWAKNKFGGVTTFTAVRDPLAITLTGIKGKGGALLSAFLKRMLISAIERVYSDFLIRGQILTI